jgi:tripartite-type tricarboxylate transporter receptor subunit TctC
LSLDVAQKNAPEATGRRLLHHDLHQIADVEVVAGFLMAPPGVPAERLARLRSAFDATVTDAAFLQEAAAMGFEVMPQSGAQIAALVADVMATPKNIVDEAQRASTGE